MGRLRQGTARTERLTCSLVWEHADTLFSMLLLGGTSRHTCKTRHLPQAAMALDLGCGTKVNGGKKRLSRGQGSIVENMAGMSREHQRPTIETIVERSRKPRSVDECHTGQHGRPRKCRFPVDCHCGWLLQRPLRPEGLAISAAKRKLCQMILRGYRYPATCGEAVRCLFAETAPIGGGREVEVYSMATSTCLSLPPCGRHS